LHGFSDALRAELRRDQIDLLLVSPSTTGSEFFDQVVGTEAEHKGLKRTAMPPGVVARKTLRAICRGKHELILSAGGKALVWFDRLFPSWADRAVAKHQ